MAAPPGALGGEPHGEKQFIIFLVLQRAQGVGVERLQRLNDTAKDYELLFAVRLSAQCTDARVNMVTPALYAKFPTLDAFANASYEEVGEAIKSCGFYNTKSKDLVECAKILLEKYGGRVPGTMEELTSLPGIGRKTANLILGDIYHQPAYVW